MEGKSLQIERNDESIRIRELLQCSTVFKVFAANCARQFLHKQKPVTLIELEELDLKFPVNDSGDSASNKESIISFTLDEPCSLRKTVVLVAGALRDTFWHLQRLFQTIRNKAPNVELIGMSQVPIVNSTHVSKMNQRAIGNFNNAMNMYCESGIIIINRSRRSARNRSNSNQTDGVAGLLRLFSVPADTLTAWQAHYEPEKNHYWTEEAAGEVVQTLIEQFENAIKDLKQTKTAELANAKVPQTRSRRRRGKAANAGKS
ncbi:hypothetical protein M3Y98_00916400 [Aphelenchoides besseyi]|nr:hypothetical protein M3Y98_00916400 [Aphelenchoides besseyi]